MLSGAPGRVSCPSHQDSYTPTLSLPPNPSSALKTLFNSPSTQHSLLVSSRSTPDLSPLSFAGLSQPQRAWPSPIHSHTPGLVGPCKCHGRRNLSNVLTPAQPSCPHLPREPLCPWPLHTCAWGLKNISPVTCAKGGGGVSTHKPAAWGVFTTPGGPFFQLFGQDTQTLDPPCFFHPSRLIHEHILLTVNFQM